MAEPKKEPNSPEINPEPVVPSAPAVAATIKVNIRNVWDRVVKNRKLNQAQLANALGLSQGAVSKLLDTSNNYQWNLEKMILFAQFAKVSADEIMKDHKELRGFFEGWTSDKLSASPELLDESYAAIEQYFNARNRTPSKTRLESLAAIVAVRLMHTDRTIHDFERVIEDVILEEAGKDA